MERFTQLKNIEELMVLNLVKEIPMPGEKLIKLKTKMSPNQKKLKSSRKRQRKRNLPSNKLQKEKGKN